LSFIPSAWRNRAFITGNGCVRRATRVCGRQHEGAGPAWKPEICPVDIAINTASLSPMNGRIRGLLAACVWASTSFAGDSNPSPRPAEAEEQRVLDVEQEWVKAEMNHDSATLRRVLDDHFVATFGAGQPYDKEGFIKAVTEGERESPPTQTLSDHTIRVDGDTAVVVGTDTVSGNREGQAYSNVYRYTVTYIRRYGHWVALAEHIVRVQPAP
jgi:ketosteroid isomerase-like protein